MKPPVLVTAPASVVVTLADLKTHLRVDHSDDDDLITALQASAAAHIDGWRGVLGRCIKSQTWRQEFDDWGTLRILMPDASQFVVKYCTLTSGHNGAHTYTELTEFRTGLDMRGSYLDAEGGATDSIIVDYTCALPAEQLDAAQLLVKLLVGHWYENRELAQPGSELIEMPFAATALITAMRWGDM